MGEWGKDEPKKSSSPTEEGGADFKCDRKLDLLAAEGVPFSEDGYLKSRDYLWDGKC